MIIKNSLIFSLFMVSLSVGAQEQEFPKLPSEEAVFASGHHLTIHLYASLSAYNRDRLVPLTSSMDDCLRNHLLLTSPWIHEKRFTNDIVQAYERNETRSEIINKIKGNRSYQAVPKMAQALLGHNLMQALKDCDYVTQRVIPAKITDL
ncbi:MAG: hypothetical protein AB7R69_03560 [Candidatus Babeliales bacterium]